MATRLILTLTFTLAALPVFAAEIAKHTTVEIDGYGNVTAISETVAHENGDTLMLDYGIVSSGSSADAAGATVQATTGRGPLEGKMAFFAENEEIVMSDRGQCQRFGPDSEAPMGMPSGGMQDYQKEMQAAQSEMDKAFAEMAKQNPQMAEQMRQALGGGIGNSGLIRPRDELELVETGNTKTIDNYETEEFQIREVRTGTLKHTVWAASVSDVPGGALVSRNTKKMFTTYEAYMEKFGVGALSSASIMGAIKDKMDSHYPILTIDHQDNSQTKLQSTNGAGPDEIEIACNN